MYFFNYIDKVVAVCYHMVSVISKYCVRFDNHVIIMLDVKLCVIIKITCDLCMWLIKINNKI